MKEFNQICKEFEQLDVLSYGAILAEKSAKILPALKNITQDGATGAAIYATLLVYPLLSAFFGESVNYEEVKYAVKLLKPESKELKNSVDAMVDILGKIDEELKNDIIIVCMMICAIDGKISQKEKRWIKQLIA